MLEKIFIKHYDDINNPKVRAQYGVLASIIGIASNLILSIGKMIIGVISGSISIIADGIDNLSDCASSIATLIGFKLSSLPPDPHHPFGHERIEYLTAIIISISTIVIGGILLESSIKGIINKDTINIDIFYVLLGVLIASILIKLFQGIYYLKIAKKIDSKSVKASGHDSFNDCIKTFFVLISIVIFKITNVNLDSYFGALVSIYIIVNGILLVKDASNPLIGEAPNKEFTTKIIDKIKGYDGVLGLHDLVIHNYGPDKTFITVHVEVDSRRNIVDVHDDCDNIERDFKKDLGIELTIHMDPVELNDPLTNEFKHKVEKVLTYFDKDLKYHDFRIVNGETHINVLFDVVVPVKYSLSDDRLNIELTNLIKNECKKIANKEVNVIINVDKDYVL